jgi:hypothetical protein
MDIPFVRIHYRLRMYGSGELARSSAANMLSTPERVSKLTSLLQPTVNEPL